MLVGHADMQRDLERLEIQADRNLMKFEKGRCKVLHLTRKNLGYMGYLLWAGRLESCFPEKSLGILRDTKLRMSQQCANAAKVANGVLCCIRRNAASMSKEMILPFYSALLRPHLKCCPQFWALHFSPEVQSYWRELSERTLRC